MNARDYSKFIMETMSTDEQATLIENLMHDPHYGCFTRPGLEYVAWPMIRERARWVIAADLDELHEANEELGYDEVNKMIKQALQIHLRESETTAVGRWSSGDELLWFLCETDDRPTMDPRKAAQRLARSFKKVGLSATFGIARVLSFDLESNIKPAMDLIQAAKRKGQRGTINQTGSLNSMLLSVF